MAEKTITQAELEVLPEDGLFGMEEREIDGKVVRVSVLQTVGALWTEDDEPDMVEDIHGQYWRIGWANGVRYKRRMRQP